MNPVKHLNKNGSTDYGPMQINARTWNYAPAAAIGTSGPGQRFNGNPAINILYAAGRFENYFVPRYGANAAGAYNSATGLTRFGGAFTVPSAIQRQGWWNAFSAGLEAAFSDRACYPHG